MIYRGYDIIAPFPFSKQPVKVMFKGKCIKEFPYFTRDMEVMDWVDAERRRRPQRSLEQS